MHYQLDDAAELVVLTPDPHATGAQVSRFIIDLVRQRPELIDWDWIQDVSTASGEVSIEDVSAVARAFDVEPARPTVTVFVTSDPAFYLWARTMDPQFRARRHLQAHSIDEARQMIRRFRQTQTRPSPEA